MLGRARQKDLIFVSRSARLLLLAICSVRMLRAHPAFGSWRQAVLDVWEMPLV
jgi:hypothetical protein